MNTAQGGTATHESEVDDFPRVSSREQGEKRVVITGFMLLFCVLGGYFAVRPIRETIGTILGREATQNRGS